MGSKKEEEEDFKFLIRVVLGKKPHKADTRKSSSAIKERKVSFDDNKLFLFWCSTLSLANNK
jgi:hypothetical protein